MRLYSQLFSKTQEITGFKNQFDRKSKKLISKTTPKLFHLKKSKFVIKMANHFKHNFRNHKNPVDIVTYDHNGQVPN